MARTAGKRVLVVEDEKELARLVELHLHDLGCQVTLAFDGPTGLRQARTGDFGLIILDLMLPGLDGLELCQKVRQLPEYTPILMLTAKSGEVDRILGLEVGADDYLTKPFSIRELVARVKAIFRRAEAMAAPEAAALLQVGELEIEVQKRRAALSSRPLELTVKEFDLLVQFARHPGRVYSRAELLDLVWGYGHDGYEHTVNSHINRLRSKIEEDSAHPQIILTVWGVGYKLFDPAAEA